MRSEYVRVRLGDHIEISTGFPFKSTGYSDTQCSVRLLRGDNVAQGVLRWNDAKRWPQDAAKDLLAYSLREDDVVLAMDRPWIAAGLKFAHVRRADLPCLLVQRVARLRVKGDLDSRFLRYVIGGKQFTDYILSVQTGTAVPHISAGQIAAFEFLLPPMHQQRMVGELLGFLDDRIDLLRQTNATFKSITQALFKSWFIDFDPVRAKAEGREPEGMDAATAALFPAEFEESALGLIPKGWKPSCIGDLADVIDCLHSKKPELLGEGRPFLQLNNIRDDGLLDASELAYVSEADYKKWTSRIEVREGDCVITNVGRVGAVAQIPASLSAAMGRNMTAIRLRSDQPYPTFLIELLLSAAMRAEIERRTDVGTILNALNVRSIPGLEFVLAPAYVLRAAESVLRPLRASMENNIERAAHLVQLRDTLLPRLISGKLRLSDVQAEIDEVIA